MSGYLDLDGMFKRDPYRDAMAALCRRRENLVKELKLLDLDIRQRAVLVIPCFTGLSRRQAEKVRKAWETIRKLGHWHDQCCEMHTWDPCPERHSGKVCGFVNRKAEIEMLTKGGQ